MIGRAFEWRWEPVLPSVKSVSRRGVAHKRTSATRVRLIACDSDLPTS